MEIAPIAGVRAIAAIKPRPVHPELSAVFDIEAAARPGDDTWTGHSGKAAGAEEYEDVEEAEEEGEDVVQAKQAAAPSQNVTSRAPISFYV